MSNQLHADDGFSLIELVIAMLILGIGVVSIMAAIGTAVFSSGIHRNYASAETVTRDYAEAINTKANTASTYQICPSVSDLTPTFTIPKNTSGTDLYTVLIEAPPSKWAGDFSGAAQPVEYWIPNAKLPNGTSTSFPNGAFRPQGTKGTIATDPLADCWSYVQSSCKVADYGGSLANYKPPASCDPGLQRVWVHIKTNPALGGTKAADTIDQYSRILVRRFDASTP